jgi:uncharacterized membrane protein YgcG
MARWVLALAMSLLAIAACATAASAARPRASSTQAQGNPKPQAQGNPVPKAPSGSPLSVESAAGQSEAATAPPSGGDALVENGLGSPSCKKGELSSSARRNCELSGFVAAPDPTGNFAFDVNIDTGYTQPGNDVAAIVQDFAGFGWMVFVSVTHGLIVMFEWCYSFDLLREPKVLEELTSGLRGARIAFTEPWMMFAFSVASVFVIYYGLIRRRVADTLGQTLAMLAMMGMGLWLMMDPTGTVGALDHWADQAGLGTLATVASGSPEEPRRTLIEDLRVLFGATVSAPWCYMEFGNIDWCEGARALDPRLETAGLAIARKEQSESGCRSLCGPGAGTKDVTLAASAALLREAKSNGELFLALPANEEARNSTKEEWSLLSVLCGGGKSADKCSGKTAAQAEFRSEKGTEPRLIGIFLIWMGGLGMLLLFGFLALHLLSASIRTVVFLLMAPVAVLAPAFGDGGRSLFRTWTMRLLAAVVSKLVFSFLLGAMLMTMNLLLHLTVLGWWGDWFLVSAFWWGVFFKRHQMVGFLHGVAQGGHAPPPHHSIARRVKDAFETPRAMLRPVHSVRRKLRTPAPDVQKRHRIAKAGHEAAHKHADEQVTRMLDRGHQQAVERAGAAPEIQSRISARQEQLGRLRRERARALAEGDRRRAAQLGVREQRVEGEAASEQKTLTEARRQVADGEATKRLSGTPHTREQRERRSRFLDAQTALPAAGRRTAEGVARDYVGLAALVGYGAEQYKRLHPHRQREARLRIDRELASRSQLGAAAMDLARDTEPAPKWWERRKAGKQFEQKLQQRMREEGHTPLSAELKKGALDEYLVQSAPNRGGGFSGRSSGWSGEDSAGRSGGSAARSGGSSSAGGSAGRSDGFSWSGSRDGSVGSAEHRFTGGSRGRGRSTVMEDAFEVAARRKRQLGREHRE